MIETLVENAKYIQQDELNGPSACEIECKDQQAALVACMETIRSNPEESAPKTCLAPVVAAWTECCAKANEEKK